MLYHHSTYARETPDTPAYIMATSGETVTWGQLDKRVNQCCHLFKGLGLKENDHIAILMENNAFFLEIVFAAIDAGLIYTVISTHLKTSETVYILNNSGAKLLITSCNMQKLASSVQDQIPGVSHRLMVNGTIDGFSPYEKALRNYPDTPVKSGMSGQFMLYSSGTTGKPKGVLHQNEKVPVGEIPLKVQLMASLYQLDKNTVYLCPAPLYHAAPLGFTLTTLAMGGRCVIMERFDAEESLSLIERYKITHSQWVPTMFIRMLKLPEEIRRLYDISSMKIAIHAAAPIPIPVKEQMIGWWGKIFYEYYSGTEGNTMTMISSEEWLSHKGSVGKCLLGKIHILDDDGNELPTFAPGLIYVENGMHFEYHKEKEKTEKSKNSKGWTTIGDIGFLDEEGYLYLTDRKSNMIISGGVNIYPQEIENVLSLHPKVKDVAVIGIPNEEFGEEVKAVVEPSSGVQKDAFLEEELIEYCKEHLSNIKCPKSVDFKDELPRTPAGKLIKRTLKEEYLRVLEQ